jgi:hypothetical protein
MPEACFQHDVRGSGKFKRSYKRPPLIPTFSPLKKRGEGEVA